MPDKIIDTSLSLDIPKETSDYYKDNVEFVVNYNRANGTNFYKREQVLADIQKRQELARAQSIASNPDPEDVRDAYIAALNPQTTEDVDRIRKFDEDAAKTAVIGTAVGTLPFWGPAAGYAMGVLANPATASTTLGSIAATGADLAGLYLGGKGLISDANKVASGQYKWQDVPITGLNLLSFAPGSSVLTRLGNWNTAINTGRQAVNTTREVLPIMTSKQYFQALPQNVKSLTTTYTKSGKKALQQIAQTTKRAPLKLTGNLLLNQKAGLPKFNETYVSPKTSYKSIQMEEPIMSDLIDLDSIGKSAKITLSDPEKYWYVAHQTGSANFPKIMQSGLQTTNGLNGTALHLTEDYANMFGKGLLKKNHLSHEGADGMIIMKFPKSKFPSGDLDDISIRLMELGESKNFEVPTEYLTFLKKTQLKQGGILKAQRGVGKAVQTIMKSAAGTPKVAESVLMVEPFKLNPDTRALQKSIFEDAVKRAGNPVQGRIGQSPLGGTKLLMAMMNGTYVEPPAHTYGGLQLNPNYYY